MFNTMMEDYSEEVMMLLREHLRFLNKAIGWYNDPA